MSEPHTMTEPLPYLSPSKPTLPDGVTIEDDGALFWVVYDATRIISAKTPEAAHQQAWFLGAHFRHGRLPSYLPHDMPRPTWMPEIGMFAAHIPMAPLPPLVWPRFGFRNWRLMIGVEFASLLLWRVIYDTPIGDMARQITMPLEWCRMFIEGDHRAGAEAGGLIEFSVFWAARKRLKGMRHL